MFPPRASYYIAIRSEKRSSFLSLSGKEEPGEGLLFGSPELQAHPWRSKQQDLLQTEDGAGESVVTENNNYVRETLVQCLR